METMRCKLKKELFIDRRGLAGDSKSQENAAAAGPERFTGWKSGIQAPLPPPTSVSPSNRIPPAQASIGLRSSLFRLRKSHNQRKPEASIGSGPVWMAVVSGCPLLPRVSVSSPPSISIQPSNSTRLSPSHRLRVSCSSSMNHSQSSPQLMEFPYSSTPVRNLMVDMVSTVESRLSPNLLPCTLPPDVQLYRNPNGSAVGSLLIRSGAASSPIDFILASWLHCKLPTGAALNISSLSCYLKDATDSPNFLMEIIQSSATSMVFVLDLCPRKDLVLHPDYLKTFYEDTQLEKQRQLLYTVPEVQPYFSPDLYVRSAISPTAVIVRIDAKDSESRLDDIVEGTVDAISKQVLTAWFDCLARGNKEVTEEERRLLKERDSVFKRKTIEIDLASSLPRMFGQETADRVLAVIGDFFKR